MMKEKEFLINALTEWCKRFEGIHVRYAYDIGIPHRGGGS